jgi:acetylornithine deacetylase
LINLLKYLATLEFEILGELVTGLACDINSIGFKALEKATVDIFGFCKPLADTGTLPLVGDLRKNGYDIQTVGYGVEVIFYKLY